MGVGALGEDIAVLPGAAMARGMVSPERATETETAIYRSYVAGLADSGWSGDESLVRYGFVVAAGVGESIKRTAQNLIMTADENVAGTLSVRVVQERNHAHLHNMPTFLRLADEAMELTEKTRSRTQ